MNKTTLQKKLSRLDELKLQIKQEEEKIQKNLGKKIITNLQLDYADLSKENIEKLINEFTIFYQEKYSNNNQELSRNE